MTLEQLLTGFLITLLFIIRPFAYRLISKKYSAKTSSLCTGTWLLIGTIITMPFFYKLFFIPSGNLHFTNPVIFLSALKGVILWLSIDYQQVINRENISASVFSAPIGMGFGVIANKFLFDESLTYLQFFSVFGLGLLGGLFFLMGSAKNLSGRSKHIFVALTFFMVVFMGIDQIVIPRTNWYVHITITNVAFFLTSFFSHSEPKDWKNAIFHIRSAVAGGVYVLGEFYLISAMVTVIPVSIANLFIRLAIPFVMVISSFLYKEGKWQEQLLFGCCALALCLPLIFG